MGGFNSALYNARVNLAMKKLYDMNDYLYKDTITGKPLFPAGNGAVDNMFASEDVWLVSWVLGVHTPSCLPTSSLPTNMHSLLCSRH